MSHLAGSGVFARWNDRARFAAVHITDFDAIAWDSELELCPDALYMQLTGKPLRRSCHRRPLRNPSLGARKTPHRIRPRTADSASPPGG